MVPVRGGSPIPGLTGGLTGFSGGFGIVRSASSEPPAIQPPPEPPPTGPVSSGPGPAPPVASYPSTFMSALAIWLETQVSFRTAFPGGLWYDIAAADPTIVYPYVVFAQTDCRRTGMIGRPSWLEDVEVKFQINTSGNLDIDDLAITLESLLFAPRGQEYESIDFPDGRIFHRRGVVKSIGLARAMGVGGVDVFQATIDSTWLVARDH